MSLVKSGQVVAPTFTVTDPAGTGLINADSLPTGVVYVNGVADAAVVTVTNLTTGKYKSSVTLPALAAGDTVEIMISAAVGGVNFAETVWSAIGDTVRLSEVADYLDTEVAAILSAVDTEVAAIKAKTDNLPSDPADQSQVEAAIAAADDATLAAIAALNDLSSADAQAAAAAALTAYDPPTMAELTAGLASADDATLAAIAGLNNLSLAQAEVAATAALAAYDGPTNAELATALSTAIGGLNDLSAAQVAAVVAAGDDPTLAAIAGLNNLSSAQAQAAVMAALAAYPVPLIADINDAIANGAGATPATFWNYTGPGGRTLTQSMIAILSSMIAGNTITITRGDTYSIPITGLGDLSNRDGLWFTVKIHPSHETDAQARIQITEDDGLIRLNGEEADVPGNASITIDDEANGDIRLNFDAAMTAALIMSGTFPSRTAVKSWSWRWDVQVRQPGPGVWTPRSGTFVVEEDVTWAT